MDTTLPITGGTERLVCFIIEFASLTQLVEFLPYTQAVGSSSLSGCTIYASVA